MQEDFIKKANLAKIETEYCEYIVLILSENKSLIISIEIKDMFFDGISIFPVSNIVSINSCFDSKAVYEYARKKITSFGNFGFLDYAKIINKDLKQLLYFIYENKIFIGIESKYQNNMVMDIGYICNIDYKHLHLVCVSVNGEIDNIPYLIKIKNIIKIELHSRYVNTYFNFIKNSRSSPFSGTTTKGCK